MTQYINIRNGIESMQNMPRGEKEYTQENKEKVNEYQTEYRNRPEVKERSKVKVVCSVCGTETRKDGLKRHMTIHDPKNYDKNGLRIY